MHSFDIDIGIREPTYSVDRLLQLAQEAIRRQDHTCAQDYLERASASIQGMLLYSAYLMHHQPEHMEEAQRTTKIEKMLLYGENNAPAELAGKACSMLADFYHRFNDRPLRRLGYMLRAARLGESANGQVIKNLCRGIAGLEALQSEKDLFGAYLCGTETAFHPDNAMRRWSCTFLSVVAESKRTPLAGLAAMQLLDLLQEDHPEEKASIDYWNKLASGCGNPKVMKK